MDYKALLNRRHPKLAEKADIHKLLSDSYRGGQVYIDNDHLWRYSSREPEFQFADRLKRAVYINDIRPIVDILVSKLYANDVHRLIPDELKFVKENIGGGISIETFMKRLSTHSAMYTCGVLVDSPSVERLEGIETLKDQIDANVNPYAKIYMPWQIRDFYLNGYGEIEWVLLDDTECLGGNPFADEKKKRLYTLWTDTTYQKFSLEGKTVELISEGEHPCQEVPFMFVNWQEQDSDFISDTSFETAAILSRQIFNVMSYLDEMLAAGTFKHLFYPGSTKDLPPDFTKNGVSGSAVTGFDGTKGTPFFAGQDLQNVAPFIEAINYYKKNILSLFGMDEDHDKKYVQSGIAKSLEFSKSENLIKSAASNMEEVEEWIMIFLGRWLGKELSVEVEYNKKYQQEDVDAELARLLQITMTPYKTVNQEAWAQTVKLLLSNIDNKKLKEIMSEIYGTNSTMSVKDMVEIEQNAISENEANNGAETETVDAA